MQQAAVQSTSVHSTARPQLSRVLTLALVAGLLAGLAAALFNAVLTEPIIDRAIAMEEAAAAAEPEPAGGHSHDAPPVSREGQRIGLWLGWGALGIAWGTVVGAAYFLGFRRLPNGGAPWWRLAVAGGGWFSLGVLAFLKYPANPPAVGDPDTINERMRNFVGLELLAALLVVAGIALTIVLIRRGTATRISAVAGVALVVAGGVVVYLVMPPAEGNVVGPELAAIVEEFRRHAFVSQLVFWAVFAAGFAWLPSWKPLALHEETPDTQTASTFAPASAR